MSNLDMTKNTGPADTEARITAAEQDYLRAIFKLSQRSDGRVTTSQLAARLSVRSASVTAMLQKMSAGETPLVQYEKGRGAMLTPSGERAALQLVRHHRLLELFLEEKLGYAWDEVHDEAERLEHVVNDAFVDRIAALLGHPTRDPHGHVIPGPELEAAPAIGEALTTLAEGECGQVRSVRDDNSAYLRELAAAGVHPDAALTIVSRRPCGETVLGFVGTEATATLSAGAASQVMVERIIDGDGPSHSAQPVGIT